MESELSRKGVEIDMKLELLSILSTQIPYDGIDLLQLLKNAIDAKLKAEQQKLGKSFGPLARILQTRIEAPKNFKLNYDVVISLATTLVAEGKALQHENSIGLPVFRKNF